ncbi:hypothetical protein [Galactobacter valiniphilus]
MVTLQPGRAVDFRFDAPHGFDGTHRLELIEFAPHRAELRHTLRLRPRG